MINIKTIKKNTICQGCGVNRNDIDESCSLLEIKMSNEILGVSYITLCNECIIELHDRADGLYSKIH